MNQSLKVMLFLALLLIAPNVVGQEPAGSETLPPEVPVTVLVDPAGDVRAIVQDQEQTVDSDLRPSVDFTGISISETPLTIQFLLHVVSFEDVGHEVENGRAYLFNFDHGGRSYFVQMANAEGVRGFYLGADLFAREAGGTSWIASLEAERLDAENAFLVRIARSLIPTMLGAPPGLGGQFTNVSAYSSIVASFREPQAVSGVEVGPLWAGDDIPDSGFGTYAIRYGISQTGHVRLHAEEPFRTSNGEASTFIFTVQANNLSPETDQFVIKPVGIPSGWDVRGPSERVTVGGSETVEFPVTVRTQFAHEHGAARSFVLELQSVTEAGSVGRVELGIRYPAVPQPAGHHSTLWLHSFDEAQDNIFSAAFLSSVGLLFLGADLSKQAFMNTDSEAGNDDRLPVQGRRCDSGLGGPTVLNVTYCWAIRLSPGLELGLDFDLDGLGTIQIPLGANLPAQGASLGGYLRVLAPSMDESNLDFGRESTTVAVIQPVGSVDLGPAGEAMLEGVIVPVEGGDYVPYQRHSDLELRLNVTLERPDNTMFGPGDSPAVLPGGWLQLPLLEYEDKVEQTFGSGGFLRLTAEAAQQRLANPGSTVVYNVTLHNDGPVEDAFRLDVAGSHEDWASITSGRATTVGPGKQARVVVAVAVPDDALDGERSDLVLQALSASDANQRALLRLVTTVDTDLEHRDDSGLAQASDENTPALPLAVLLVGLLAAARRRP